MAITMSQLRLLRFLRTLSERGPVNAYAVAFILTESYFRGWFWRFCELAYAVLTMSIVGRVPSVTLGKCQVGLVHWQNAFGTKIPNLVRAVLSDVSNYDVCCAYLNIRECRSLRELAIHYNGKPSHLYVLLLRSNLLAVTSALGKLENSERSERGRISVASAARMSGVGRVGEA